MTNNEKKMMVHLGKSLVLQMDFNLEIMKALPEEKAIKLRPFYESIETQLDSFIALARKEWGTDDED